MFQTNMKTQKIIITLTVAAAVSLMVGCEKKSEPQVNETTTKVSEQPAAMPATAPAEATKAVEAAKPVAEQAASDATAAAKAATTTATTTAADVTAKFNAVLAQAKTLMGQNKYSDALNTLQQVANLKLSPEQEKVLAGLKEQIQKAMASDAAKSVGNLLK